ncbi:MAG: hypothetical protein H0U71_09815 [Gammaproteobacteria bacterium]|nr:hypothetical protein [Gammaproteobacteria bacterium]
MGDPDSSSSTPAFREWHVRDFMYRHEKMLSWDANELSMLETEKNHWAEQLRGFENVRTTYTN